LKSLTTIFAFVVYQPRFAELLKRSVDVDRSEAKRFGKHVLSKGNVAAVPAAYPAALQRTNISQNKWAIEA
jgi:hypothetical protein